MEPLPFSLRVPGVDAFTLRAIGSTRYLFSGRLQLDDDFLYLEWTGIAEVDEVALSGIRSERVGLPLESLRLPIVVLRTAELRGGWLRPHLELIAARLDALRSVPGEEAGRLRLWLARRDRASARRVADYLRKYLAAVADAPVWVRESHTPMPTPPDGAA